MGFALYKGLHHRPTDSVPPGCHSGARTQSRSWEPLGLVSQGAREALLAVVGLTPGHTRPPPTVCQTAVSSLQGWGPTHTISRVSLYLLNAQCAQAKNKTKRLSKTLSKFQQHTGLEKMEPRFLLFLISHWLGL